MEVRGIIERDRRADPDVEVAEQPVQL